MSQPVQDILSLIDSLSDTEQMQVMHLILMRMMQKDGGLSPAWQEEIDARIEAYESGNMSARPWQEVMNDLRNNSIINL